MESNIKSYEAQVLELGNGKMLEPGYYDKNFKKIADMDDSHKYIEDKVMYAVCPKSAKTISESMFSGMFGLCSIVLPEDLEVIERFGFFGCRSLKNISLPSTLKRIETGAFNNSGLVSVEIPESVNMIGSEEYSDCGWGVFGDCKELVSFSMPTSKNEVIFNANMFLKCKKVKNITLPYGLKEIPNGMFSMCSALKEIVIPKSVTKIGEYAFYKCKNLEYVRIESECIEIADNAFDFYKKANAGSGIVEYKGLKIPMERIKPISFHERLDMLVSGLQ